MNAQCWQLNWNRISIFTAIVSITLGAALIPIATAPVSAQSVIVGPGVISQPTTAGSLIFGSPIPTPVPVHPTTGHLFNPNYYSYPANPNYYSYPIRRAVGNSTLLSPVLVNPSIQNSTLINPVIINQRGFLAPVYGGSRLFQRYGR